MSEADLWRRGNNIVIDDSCVSDLAAQVSANDVNNSIAYMMCFLLLSQLGHLIRCK